MGVIYKMWDIVLYGNTDNNGVNTHILSIEIDPPFYASTKIKEYMNVTNPSTWIIYKKRI